MECTCTDGCCVRKRRQHDASGLRAFITSLVPHVDATIPQNSLTSFTDQLILAQEDRPFMCVEGRGENRKGRKQNGHDGLRLTQTAKTNLLCEPGLGPKLVVLFDLLADSLVKNGNLLLASAISVLHPAWILRFRTRDHRE